MIHRYTLLMKRPYPTFTPPGLLQPLKRPNPITSLCFTALFLLSGPVFSQLTAVDATIYVDSAVVEVNDTLSMKEYKLLAAITPDDLSDLGTLSVVVYNADDYQQIYAEIVKTKSEMISENLISGDRIILELYFYHPDLRYQVSITPQTTLGAYASDLTLFFPL